MISSNQVHAPYHFVPLSKWVYMPDWAHLVSHDVPFKNGYSGVLHYQLTNLTPLCVGDKQEKAEGQITTVKWARDPNGNPVIPSSSLKGMVRSVLEIASFGKFSAIDNNQFSYRDVSSKSSYLAKVMQSSTTQAAWLKHDVDRKVWTLSTCQFAKIKHKEANQSLNKKLKNDQTAIEKYKQVPLSQTVKINTFSKKSKIQGSVTWAKDIGTGSVNSHMIFCNHRIQGMKQSKPEDYDFSYCYFGDNVPVNVDATHINKLANNLFESHDEAQVEFLQKNQHTELGIPVFALFNKSDKKLHSLGLAKMPRVLYNHAASDLAQFQQGNARISEHYFDMSELMFGTLRDKGLSLKSRVFFSDAALSKSTGLFHSNNVTLNSPKATFKSAYIEQPKAGDDNDYDDKNSKLAGWKRYIASTEFSENENSSDNVNVQTTLELLSPSSEFTGQIVFHNLKKEELGALVWALQLGADHSQQDVFHGLGHGKSLGAGAVSINITPDTSMVNGSDSSIESIQAFGQQFIEHMNTQYPANTQVNWQMSPQIRHLLAIADAENNKDRDLSYHPLSDFKQIKNNKDALSPITVNNQVLPRTESAQVAQTGAISFGQGRLAALISKDDEGDAWITSEKAKQNSLLKDKAYALEVAEKQRQKALEAEKLASLPEDFQWVASLEIAFKEAKTTDEKRLLNTTVEELLNRFINEELDKDAAQNLVNLVSDKSCCEYLNIKDKKKLKPRKEKCGALTEKYKLTS